MDYRWDPIARDSKREVKILLHPTASIEEVRAGFDVGSDDSVDLSDFVSQCSQTRFDVNLTLNWNRELFGETQPKPHQILELQLYQHAEWKPLWIGEVESITAFTLSRGERSMQLIAKTRDSQKVWRVTKRVTSLFPQLTDLSYIIQRVARTVGMQPDEIILPPSALTTAHSNTQLADMTAWDMITAVCLPCGWSPFIDGLGRLRVADRSLQGRLADVVLDDDQIIKVGAQRQNPPASRVRVLWLNPTMKKSLQVGRKLAEATLPMGWYLPFYKHKVYFSDDRTQRATDTTLKIIHSANSFAVIGIKFCTEDWEQQTENEGRILLINFSFIGVVTLLVSWAQAHSHSDGVAGVVTVPIGRLEEAIYQSLWCFLMMNVGVGTYEIWGTPYDWVHARNTTEAFDSNQPIWVDDPVDIETDFIVNEPHAQAVAVRELIYMSRAANKWSVQLVDDPRIEYGDILQFPDGSQLYVEDYTRPLTRGSEATLEVKGFLLGGPCDHPSPEALS